MPYDVAVIGLGAMGSSAARALARRGVRVVAIDQFEPGHENGSSHGESRAIRLSYFEHPSYVPLARAAFEGWRELERLTNTQILTVTGILEAGFDGAPSVTGSIEASILHGLPHEVMDGREASRRFPQFRLPVTWQAVFQPDAGLLRPEIAVRLNVALAKDAGAEIQSGVRVHQIAPRPGAIRIETDQGMIDAGAVVVASGAWIGDLLPDLRPHLTLTRQVLAWFQPSAREQFGPERFPVFFLEGEQDTVYGFPDFAATGVKAASHKACGLLSHADDARQDAGEADVDRIRRMLVRHIPEAAGPATRAKTCIYTRTPDEDFIVDLHPDDKRIVVASPCSGHGFKFSSVLGEALADLALRGETSHDLSRFTLSRFPNMRRSSAAKMENVAAAPALRP